MSWKRSGRVGALMAALLLTAAAAAGGDVLHWKPADSLSLLREKLAGDPNIEEVVFQEGVYRGGLHVGGPREADSSRRPLLLRAAEGARVVFEGSKPLEGFQPHEELAGVFRMDYTHPGGEYPKLWEPRTRVRYRLAAARETVARFPATYVIEGNRLLFHSSDGEMPRPGDLLMSAEDCGLFIDRPGVTVRGMAFRDFLAREKWSTGIDLRVDRITVEDCTSSNCSIGFIVTGNDNVLRRSTVEDAGGGVYIGGENALIEDCRLYKRRDGFMVPMYSQDDTGIQFYSPARGGVVRGNLCEGFGMGVFIKASTAPYLVEHNTLAGLGQGLGFGATSWHPRQRFRYNIIAGCARQVEASAGEDASPPGISHNCYWSSSRNDLKAIGDGDLVGDPRFVRPEWRDYRLAADSPCLKLADDRRPCGAFPALGDDDPAGQDPPRRWHVSETGRDGLDGSAEQPVRTIQFAVDRAKPGDVVIVHPGVYPDPVRITRGGTRDRPIAIRAEKPWQAVLDSNRRAEVMVDVRGAPHVEIEGLEIRWYGRVAIQIEESPHVTVAGCRIWNAHWHGAWPTGTAVRAVRSPGFAGRRNVLFRQEHAFWFYHSPSAALTRNTCVANLYSAAAFLYSCEGSVCRDNSFAFQGNDVIVIEEDRGQKEKLKTFDCDHNNYGTALREQPPGVAFDSLTPRKEEAHLRGWSKALVNYSEYNGERKRFVSLNEWRLFSGLDAHTIIADPLYAGSAARDFRLDPRSPNRGAGADGATIGALEALPEAAAPARADGAAGAAVHVLENLVIYEDPRFYAAFPSIVRRPGGELLVAFRRAPERRRFGEAGVSHTDPNSYLVLVRSGDGGRTWSREPELIHAHPFGGSQDPCMVPLRDGTILCSSYAWALLLPEAIAGLKKPLGRAGDFVFLGGYLMRSRDGGRSWQGPILPPPCRGEAHLDLSGNPVPAYNRGAMCEGADGKLYWVVASQGAGSPRSAAHLLVSEDQGQSWKHSSVVAQDANIDFNETSLYETPRGHLVAFIRTENFGDRACIARSTDRGLTFKWQDAGFQGHPHHALRLPDRRVLLVYGYRHRPFGIRARVLDPECSGAAAAPEIVLRDDGGNGDLGYPWATMVSGDEALVVYYFNRADGARHIAGTRLRVDGPSP